MTQVALSDDMFEKLQVIAFQQQTNVSVLLEKILEAYLAVTEYDEADDPAINLLCGPTDLAVHAKEILREEINAHSGWTQKPNDS